MDGRGGCCIARYGYDGGGGGEYDMSKMDRIMLRFRPIAPKPVNGGGSISAAGITSESRHGRRKGRGKRRCVKRISACEETTNNNKKKRSPKKTDFGAEKTVVTLSLLPESPEPKGSSEKERNSSSSNSATWLSFESFENSCGSSTGSRKVGGMRSVMGKSCVTVDCVTDTWVEGMGLGCTDEERRMNLERDTCPGFVSDGVGRVVWTNGAYRSMVGQEDLGGDMMVWLVVKERAAAAVGMSCYPAFTCRVRVQYSVCGGSSAQDWSSLTLPCDVWRMENGGFAWRLDVKAALCLGR